MPAKLTISTLKKRADFLRLNRGHKFITPFFILRYAPTAGEGACRIGYTVTTKCGNAVVRNRIKRRLRMLVRELKGNVAPGTDYVLIARADAAVSAAVAPIDAMRAELTRAFAAAATRISEPTGEPRSGRVSGAKGGKPPSKN